MSLNLYPLSFQCIVTTKVQMLCCVNCVCACAHACVCTYVCVRVCACMRVVCMCLCASICVSVTLCACDCNIMIHSTQMYVTSYIYIYVHLYVQCLASRNTEHFLLFKLCCHTSPWCCTFKGRHFSQTASKHLRHICWQRKALFPCFGGSQLDLQSPFTVCIVSSESNADGLDSCLF